MTRARVIALATLATLFAVPAHSADDLWPAYLDYAYVYSSADGDSLRARLREYGAEAGVPLDEYIALRFAGREPSGEDLDEAATRREAIAYLLHYLATGDPDSLEKSVEVALRLEDRLGRHENRYWYHYILAHRALDRGQRIEFVAQVLEMWLGVVVPLESPYETLHTLSLSDSPNSGFVSALPYVYENVSRLILIKSQEMGIDRDLDPLSAIVRLLHDGRVGAHPDVIPAEASSFDYLDRIVARLDGPESDGGSLTFTLALFEASKYHDRARSLLAMDGLTAETVKAIEVAAGAYEVALNRADTVQGQAAVYARVLRQLGEVYAAKQRLGVDPEVEVPFSLEGAVEVYTTLHAGLDGGWTELGYRHIGRDAYLHSLHGLWEEIQEASLNVADYYLARSLASQHRADEHARSAARIYSRYLSFFQKFADARQKEGVPQSAYFAAYEAARGFGDAFLRYGSGRPQPTEVELATKRYVAALRIFPFDRELWSSVTAALERLGRENEYLALVRPIAESVTRSRAIDTWIESGEVGAKEVETLRRALADNLVVMYLGFGKAKGIDELEASLGELRSERLQLEERLAAMVREREKRERTKLEPIPAAPAPGATSVAVLSSAQLESRIQQAGQAIERIERQIAARSRAIPLYRATLEMDDLAGQLRAERDHSMHALLRRMYHENRAGTGARTRR